jgi:hypothetical protein
MRKLIGLALGAGLLVLGTGAVLAQTAPTPSPSTTTEVRPDKDGLLSEVLDDLVADGTINQAAADKILSELDARRTALRAEREALREQFRTFLEDGTLSADELAQLPEDHPLRNLDQFLEDGQLTQDELQQLRRGFGFGGRGGFGHHAWGPKDGTSPDAPAAPSATPSA